MAAIDHTTRTIAYTRVSTDTQAEHGQSLEVQRHQLEGWALMRDCRFDQVLVEASVSGVLTGPARRSSYHLDESDGPLRDGLADQ